MYDSYFQVTHIKLINSSNPEFMKWTLLPLIIFDTSIVAISGGSR